MRLTPSNLRFAGQARDMRPENTTPSLEPHSGLDPLSPLHEDGLSRLGDCGSAPAMRLRLEGLHAMSLRPQ